MHQWIDKQSLSQGLSHILQDKSEAKGQMARFIFIDFAFLKLVSPFQTQFFWRVASAVCCDAFEGPHGGFRDTSRGTMQTLMERGESVCMIPGAYQEATVYSHSRDRVALAQRKGFVKYCLKHGYRLHPVYTFGESDTYCTLGGFDKFRLWLNKWGIPTVVFWGHPWCPLLPRRGCELLTYVGHPLELPQIPEPTQQEVDEWHGKYVASLQELFDKNKAEAGRPHARLEVL